MTHPSLSVVAIAFALWLTDLGVTTKAEQASPGSGVACQEQVQSPGSDGSDLEIVVCADR